MYTYTVPEKPISINDLITLTLKQSRNKPVHEHDAHPPTLANRGQGRAQPGAANRVFGMTDKQEVKVHTRGPDRGNPPPMRQVHCHGSPWLRQKDLVR